MHNVLWLAAPYLSTLVILKTRPIARRVAGHTTYTLSVGWLAVIALFTAVAGLWSAPGAVKVLCAVVSGLAMISTGPGRDDGPGPGPGDDDDDPPPPWDWDAFDVARSGWGHGAGQGRFRRPSGVA